MSGYYKSKMKMDVSVFIVFIILLSLSGPLISGQYMTSGVNFEKYFRMEEEMLSYCDGVVDYERMRHEGEDVHGILNISRTIDEIRKVHNDIVRPVNSYWKHPINQFHLAKRLYKDWSEVIRRLVNSDGCGKALFVKFQNIEDNLPTELQFTTIAYSVVSLQKYYGLSFDDVIDGVVFGRSPHQNLSLHDIFTIGVSCYDREDYVNAAKWLSYTVTEMERQSLSVIETGRNISNVMNTLAASYYKMGNTTEAIETLEVLLKRDPTNRSALRNVKQYESKEYSGLEGSTGKSKRYMEELCSSEPMTNSSRSGLSCLYFPMKNQIPIERSKYKAEVLRRKPLIIYFHDAFNEETSDALSFLGYNQVMVESTRNKYRPTPTSAVVNDYTNWRWLEKTQQAIGNMTFSYEDFVNKEFKAVNIGLQALDPDIRQENDESIGKVIVFLSKRTIGGDLVFPLSKIKIPVKKGDMVFYESTVGSVSICPVIYGSQWYGIQDWYGSRPENTCRLKRTVVPY